MTKIRSTYGPAAITQTGTHMNSYMNSFAGKTSLLHHHDTVSSRQENTHTNTLGDTESASDSNH